MRLNHNLASLNIYNQLIKNEKSQSIGMNKISSGNKISKAVDGPYLLGQSEAQRMQIRGLQMAQRNVQDGISMLQATGDALDSANSMLQRMRELTIQAGGATSDGDKTMIQNEINQTLHALDDVMNNTEFNGVKLLNDPSVTSNKTPAKLLMASGANINEIVNIPKFNLTSSVLGDESAGKLLSSIDVTTTTGINEGIALIDSSSKTLMGIRTQYGALENKFDSMYTNIGEIADEIQKAESGIRDTDVAQEIAEISKNSILNDVGNALLAQTNRFPMEVLKILENVRR